MASEAEPARGRFDLELRTFGQDETQACRLQQPIESLDHSGPKVRRRGNSGKKRLFNPGFDLAGSAGLTSPSQAARAARDDEKPFSAKATARASNRGG